MTWQSSKRRNSSIAVVALFWLGLAAAGRGDGSTAPREFETHAAAGETALANNEFGLAISSLEEAIELGDTRFETSLNLAKAMAAAGQTDRALEVLHRLLDRGYNPAADIRRSRLFDGLRDAPAYSDLRKRLEPCIGGAYDDFAFTVGEWDVLNGANEGNASDKSVVTAVADGCGFYEKYWSSYGYKAESFTAFDDVSREWTRLVIDNQGFFLNFTQVSDADGVVLEARDEQAIYRAITTRIDASSYRTTWLRSQDNGQTWHSYVDSLYRRYQ